jgi:hypothetical protein
MPPFGADPVVDHDALVERDAERLANDPRHDVGAAPGPERHDDGDRPGRIGLGLRGQRRRRHRERRCAAEQSDEIAPSHGLPAFWILRMICADHVVVVD